jgi:hypothetical protein
MEMNSGSDHPDVALCLCNLGSVLVNSDKKEIAEPIYRRALTIAEASLGSNHLLTTSIRANLSAIQDQES